MFNFIGGFIVTIISLLLGFYLGSKSERSGLPEETLAKVKQVFKKIQLKREAVGGVTRPTAQDIERYDNPKLKEEEQAMAETFSQIIK